jgi:hypothetical protein
MVVNLNALVIYIFKILFRILTIENVGTAVNYQGNFITCAPGTNFYKTIPRRITAVNYSSNFNLIFSKVKIPQ